MLSFGIDTSNYKTSVAIVAQDGEILFDKRSFLDVKKGQRGLRQSEAFFQHVNRLPDFICDLLGNDIIREAIGCIAVSDRPRPVAGSYMPVFSVGLSFARALSAALNVPLYAFSHQEGHVEAVRYYSAIKEKNSFICFHFSGGTTEAVLVDRKRGSFDIVGGSKDISYGQVLDRIGVALGFDFPCGENIDKLALACTKHRDIFSPIKVNDCFLNLSGIESQGQRTIESYPPDEIAWSLMDRLCCSVKKMTLQLCKKYQISDFIFAGGVSASQYLRRYMKESLPDKINLVMGDPGLSTDNAVGTALLGGNKIWL